MTKVIYKPKRPITYRAVQYIGTPESFDDVEMFLDSFAKGIELSELERGRDGMMYVPTGDWDSYDETAVTTMVRPNQYIVVSEDSVSDKVLTYPVISVCDVDEFHKLFEKEST